MHPKGMIGLDLRANSVDGRPVFILVDFGPPGTLTSPNVLKTLEVDEARNFVRLANARCPLRLGTDTRSHTSGLTCSWCYSAHDVQPSEGEFLCGLCRKTISHLNIVSAVDE